MNRSAVLVLVVLSGCASPPPASHLSTREADAAFGRIAQDYLTGYLDWRPQSGTALGLHQYDGRMTDFSRVSIDVELARLKSFDSRLAAFDRAALSPEALCDYRILRAAISEELFAFEAQQVYTRNPMTYAGALDLSLYIKRDFAPLEDRARSIIALLNQTPALLALARTNLDDVLAKPFVETALDIANGAVDFLAGDLVEALKGLPDASLRAQFTAANERAIAAMRAYAAWLKTERLPRATAPYAVGEAAFGRRLREGQLVKLSPEQILAIGRRELRREQQAFAETARTIDASKNPLDVFREIQKDHPTAPHLIPDTKKNLEAIRQFVVDHNLVTIPSPVRARVEETPAFLRATSFASMDTPGPFETKATEAFYYVTPPETNWPASQTEEWLTAFNSYTSDVVSIHEAYPGHYVQFLCLNASTVPRLRKILANYGFVEGWAHYTEQMMLEQGFGAGPLPFSDGPEKIRAAKYRMAQSSEALLRLCRLCVAIQMHCQGMTVDEATRFFRENCYYEEKTARQEAMRGSYDPGYLMYSLGKLQILKLREDYRRQQGPGFSLEQFHDELLRHGMPPVPLLRPILLKDPALWDESL